MGKMKSKEVLEVREPNLIIKPIAGWTWYCGYHDVNGVCVDEHEAKFMSEAHMYYTEVDGDVCEIFIRSWDRKKE